MVNPNAREKVVTHYLAANVPCRQWISPHTIGSVVGHLKRKGLENQLAHLAMSMLTI